MNNDDVKKFINISNLYSEVDLEENKKVDEGILDWLEKKLGINQDEAEEVVNALPKTAKTELDNAVDKNKLVTPENPNIQGNNYATDADGNISSTDKPVQPGQGGGADQDKPVGKSFTDIGQAMLGVDQVNVGDKVTIGGQEATVNAGSDGNKFYLDPNGKPITAATATDDGSVDAVGSEEDPTVTDQEGGVAQGMDQADAETDDAKQEPVNTKDLMTRYNEGGKKAMPEIKKLQTELGRLGFDPNGIDGKYGNGTYKAVQQFQKANGLSVDGQAGPETLAAIEKAIKGDTGDAKSADTGDAKSADTGDAKSADTGDAKEVPSTTDDAMDPKNQQQDINTAQPNADVDRYIELLNKLEGGQQNAGTPNATQGQVVASYDFRDLIALVESKLLNEQLTQAEMAELKALHDKVQGHIGIPGMDDEKITKALNRYLKLVDEPAKKQAAPTVDKKGPDGQYDGDDLGNAPTTPTVTLDTISATIKKGITFDQLQKAVTDAEALEPEDAAKDANLLKKLGAKAKQLVSTKEYRARYVLAKGAQQLGIDGLYRPDGKTFIFMKDGQPSGARGGSLNSAMQVAQLGLLPPKKVEDFKKLAPNKPKFQAILDAHAKATGEGGADAVANANVAPSKELNLTATGTNNFNIKRNQPFVDIMDGGKKTRVYGDPALLKKRYPDQKINQPTKESTMKKAIKEASMNISINGSNAAEVAELAGILKNAGMNTGVQSMPGGAALDKDMEIMPHNDMDGHDDMVSKMRLMEPPSSDSPCGMDEEGVEEDSWDNSPEETYADTQTMTKDLSGGLNREKKAYPAAQDGDNAMAVETSIKEQLWAALNEKMTAEGRGRGKTLKASRGEKLNASRGNKLMASRGKDKKTTEGSRGKKSRGKKSRG